MASGFMGRANLKVWLPAGAAAILVIGIITGLGLQAGTGPLIAFGQVDEVEGNAHGIGPVEEILRYIEAKYVDDVSREALIDGAVGTLLAELDPHSSYISAQRVDQHQEQLDGELTGIGIDVLMIRDSVAVMSVLASSPAEQAGLRPYDRIISIGGTTVSSVGTSAVAVRAMLHRSAQQSVRLNVFRPGSGNLLPVDIQLDRIAIPSVARGLQLDGDVAYIRIHQFATNTYNEFMGELERLTQDSAARHLIIDLRSNSGGYLQEAVSLLSQLFVDEGQLLVYTKGAHSPRKDYVSTGRVYFPIDRVSVIIDGGSASASEIVAGAVQDWDRGSVIGQRSFGKGLVQELYPLKSGGALHITVSRYFTPSGRSIQRDYEDLGAYRSGYLDSLSEASAQAFVTAGGRPVYGGGGIAPDVDVYEDRRLRRPEFVRALVAVNEFAFEEVEKPSNFDATAALSRLRTYLATEGLMLDDADWSYYAGALSRELRFALLERTEGAEKGNAARALDDPFVQSALKAIRSPAPIAREG